MPGNTGTNYNLSQQNYDALSLASLYLRTANLPDTAVNRRLLAGWFWAESGHSGPTGVKVFNNNPLNITTSSSNYHTFSGNTLHFANYATPQEGAQAWWNLLNNNPGYRGIITAMKVQDTPQGFSSAIGHSPWGTSSSGVLSAVYYMQHFAADTVSTVYPVGGGTTGGAPYHGGGTGSIVFHFFNNYGNPIDVTYPVGTPIDQKFIDDLALRLEAAGVFGPGGATDTGKPGGQVTDLNPVDMAVSTDAYNAFRDALKPLIGTTVQKDTVSALGKYVLQAASSQPSAPNLIDLTGVNTFLGNLNKNNILHVAAIPAGAVLLFFGARLLLGSAGVGTEPSSGSGGSTTIVRERQAYPVILRGA